MPFTLPALPYDSNALEPAIDKNTMEIHHGKHHLAYITNLNKAIANTEADSMSIEKILENVSKFSMAIRNNGGGHYNHRLFWTIMGPGMGGKPVGKLAEAIQHSFGSFDDFKKKFTEAGLSRFGSGWVWLIKNTAGKLEIISTPNQDNPLMETAETKGFPVLALDVWEHAYYLNYQNRRQDYIEAWWNVVNWQEAEKRF